MANATLNIIGAGQVARLLARQWAEAGLLQVQGVCNRSLSSARAACQFIGSGEALSSLEALKPASFYLIGCPDDSLSAVASKVAGSHAVPSAAVAFHLSGSRSHTELQALGQMGVATASLHPLMTVPDALSTYRDGALSTFALEGDGRACDLLAPLCGEAHIIPLKSSQKPLYHAANTLLCNHLLALVEAALSCYAEIGVEAGDSAAWVAPLVHATLRNAWQVGPVQALTGPLARGDVQTVRHHLEHLPARLRPLYQSLGRYSLDLVQQRSELEPAKIAALMEILTPRDDVK